MIEKTVDNVISEKLGDILTSWNNSINDTLVRTNMSYFASNLSAHGEIGEEIKYTGESEDRRIELTYFIDKNLVNARLKIDYSLDDKIVYTAKADFIKETGNLQKVEFNYHKQ